MQAPQQIPNACAVTIERLSPGSDLQAYPPAEKWDDWREYDVVAVAEAGGEALPAGAHHLLQLRGRVRPARLRGQGQRCASGSSRATRCIRLRAGRNCAKGPATINQIHDPERILHPLRRAGARGEGKWARVSWDEALADIGGRIRKAFQEGRRNEVMYHVGRPGHERAMDRVLEGLGHRRPQLAHQRLLVLRPAGLRAVVAATTAPAPTTPTPASSCCSPRTSRPATTSTPTRSASSRASSRGRSSR